jgi:hypothetical protein
MKKFAKECVGAAALVLMLQAGGAAAADSGVYMAVDVGQSSYDLSKSEFDAIVDDVVSGSGLTVVNSTSSFKKHATGYGFAVGYRFNKYIATELGYVGLGKSKYHSSGTVNNGTTNLSMELGSKIESTGAALSLIGSLPLGDRFSLDARLGSYGSKTKLGVTVSLSGSSASESDSSNKANLFYGAGATWSLNAASALRLNYTLYRKAVDDDRNVSQISIGYVYSFGR